MTFFGDNSYTNKDMKDIREDLMNYLREANPNWTDYNYSSTQEQYLDICAGVVDMLLYYLDNQALETYLMTARQEKNIKAIMTEMNYFIPPLGTARGLLRVNRKAHEMTTRGEVETYVPGRIMIPKYTKVFNKGDDSIPPYLTEDALFLDEQVLQGHVPVIQGEYHKLRYPIETVKESYKLYLTDTPVPLEYIKICDETWEKVDDAFLEIKGGKKYSVHADSKDRIYILFTYDWRNYLPDELDGFLEIEYIDSLGKKGLVDSGSLCTVTEGVYDIDTMEDMSLSLTYTNDEDTYGAFDKPSLNEQKANARNWLRTYDRIITLEDFDTMLRKYPWVRDCYVADWRTNSTLVTYPHEAKAWIVTNDGVDVNTRAFDKIKKELEDKTVMMTTLFLNPAEFLTQEWEVGITVVGNNEEKKQQIRQKVEDTLKSRYALKNFCDGDPNSELKFGFELKMSWLESEIARMSDAIDEVYLPITEDIVLRENQFLNLKSVKVAIVEV